MKLNIIKSFPVLLYVGLLASFSLNVTLLLRKPLPPTMSTDNHGKNKFWFCCSEKFRIWPKLLINQSIKKNNFNILLFQHLSSQQLQPPPLPPSTAWAPPHPPKGASPTQPPALSQVPYLCHYLGKSSTSCWVLPPPFQVFTQCQFLTQLNSRHARAAIVMDPLQKQTHIQTLMEAKKLFKKNSK